MPGFIHNFVLTLFRAGIIPSALQMAVDKEFVFRQKPTDKHREKFGVTSEKFEEYFVHSYGVPKDGEPILYFCHGGGYVAGMFKSYYDAVGPLHKALGFPVIVPDYPMPMEVDALTMRAWALAHFKRIRSEYPRSPIIVGGDSAGANMALALAQELGANAKDDIMALYILYGWLDLSRKEEEFPDNREEVFLDATYIPKTSDRFRGDLEPDDPRISPLFGDMSNLPLTRIISADKDMLYAESLALDLRLKQNDCAYTHNVHFGYAHDFWLLPTPDGRRAMKEMARMMKGDVGLG